MRLVNNPLVYKSDTVVGGDPHHMSLQDAFVAHSSPFNTSQFRTHLYGLRGDRGRARSTLLSSTSFQNVPNHICCENCFAILSYAMALCSNTVEDCVTVQVTLRMNAHG